MDLLKRTRKAVKANPTRKDVNAPIHPQIVVALTLESFISQNVRFWQYDRQGLEFINTGKCIGWYQCDDTNGVMHTWLCVQAVGRLRPVMVEWECFAGFMSMMVGV